MSERVNGNGVVNVAQPGQDALSASPPLSPTALAVLSSQGGAHLSMRAMQSWLISRFMLTGLAGGTYSQFAGRRNLNLILGYDDAVNIDAYRYEYERGGIAKRIVEIFPRATWANGFEVVEDAKLKRKTPFEKSVDSLFKRLGVLGKLLRASILANIGHYSVILIGAPGDPETELPPARSFSSNNIAYLMPLGEDKVRVEELVGQRAIEGTSEKEIAFDPRFGQPLYYQINLAGTRNQSNYNLGLNASANFSRRVHWSRVIHIVREPLDNEVYCAPILEAVWNLLHDLKKMTGGLSEAALRRGWPGLSANVDKDAKLDSDEKAAIRTELDEYNVGMTNGIVLRKVALQALQAQGQLQIKENAEAIIQQISGTLGIPMRLLLGSERGDLASTQDRSNFSDRVMELRASHNDVTVRALVSRLTDYGYLPPPRNPDYEIEWPEEEEMSEEEKAKVAKLLKEADIMTQDERRDRIYGLDPLPKEIEDEGEIETPDSEIVPAPEESAS